VAGTPTTEVCNNIDDDCNGVVDNGFAVGAAFPCTAGVGSCATTGPQRCSSYGGILCYAVPETPTPEVCNGLDDDCNGVVDDGIVCP